MVFVVLYLKCCVIKKPAKLTSGTSNAEKENKTDSLSRGNYYTKGFTTRKQNVWRIITAHGSGSLTWAVRHDVNTAVSIRYNFFVLVREDLT